MIAGGGGASGWIDGRPCKPRRKYPVLPLPSEAVGLGRDEETSGMAIGAFAKEPTLDSMLEYVWL